MTGKHNANNQGFPNYPSRYYTPTNKPPELAFNSLELSLITGETRGGSIGGQVGNPRNKSCKDSGNGWRLSKPCQSPSNDRMHFEDRGTQEAAIKCLMSKVAQKE